MVCFWSVLASAQAGDLYFDVNGTADGFGTPGAAYTITTGNNWSPSVAGTAATVPWTGGNAAIFGATMGGTDFDGSTFTMNAGAGGRLDGITINSTGATITFTGSGNLHTGADSTWTVANGSTLNVNINYSADGGMNMGGGAMLAGEGVINFNTALGQNCRSTRRGITQDGALTVNLKAGPTTGTAYFDGGYTLENGTLNFGAGGAATTFKQFTVPGKNFTINGGALDNTSGSGSVLTIGSAGWKIGGDFTFIGSSGMSMGSSPVVLSGDPTITVHTNTLSIGGVISGSGVSLTKAGAGALALNRSNTYTGPTIVSAGTLKLAPTTSIPSGLKIMPLGDSITYGALASGYRGYLYNKLNPVAANFRFVGVKTGAQGPLPASHKYHNGYPSYATLDLSNNLNGYDPLCYQTYGVDHRNPQGGYWITGGNGTGRAAVYPDIILLLVGANDINQNGNVHPEVTRLNFESNLTTFVSNIVTLRPNSQLLLAKMTPYPTSNANHIHIPTMNASISAVASNFQAQGSKITVVDLFTGFPSNGLVVPNNVHPNATGYSWMATQWYNAIVDLYSQSGGNIIPTDSTVSVALNAVLDLNDTPSTLAGLTGAGNVLLGSATLQINNSDDAIFDGVISETGGVTKMGNGTFTLNGTNTYTGPTTVSNGSLLVNGRIGNSPVTVAAGGLLGGSGMILGPVTVDGALSPGSSAGTLTVSNDLVLIDTALLAYDLGAAGSDSVNVSGDMTLDGTLNLHDAGGFGAGTYTLFTYTGALTDNGVVVGTVPNELSYDCTVTHAAGQVQLLVEHSAFGQWQVEQFGSVTNAAGEAGLDQDGDGMNNWDEFLAGTEPTNNMSLLMLSDTTEQDGPGYTLTWSGVSGHVYSVERSTNMMSDFATIQSDIPWMDPINTTTDDFTGTPVFYRIKTGR